MPLAKPNPNDPLRSSDLRDNAIYTEASTPHAGSGISVRRSPAGTTLSLSPARLAAQYGGGGTGVPEPTEKDFPDAVVSIDASENWHKSAIETATPGAVPAGFLTKTTAGKLKLSAFGAASKLSTFYGELDGALSKVAPGSSIYAFPYAFLAKKDDGDWSWVTPSGSVGAVESVLCKVGGNLSLASVIEFTCPVSGGDNGPGTDSLEV